MSQEGYELAKQMLAEIIPLFESGVNSEETEEAQYFVIGFATKFNLAVEREQLATWLAQKNFQCVLTVLSSSAGAAAGSSSLAPRRPNVKSTLDQWRDDDQRRERAKRLLTKNAQLDLGSEGPNEKIGLIVCGIAAVYIKGLHPTMVTMICSRYDRLKSLGVTLLAYVSTNILPQMDDGAAASASATTSL